MSTELVLLLALYAFIFLGFFFGDNGPMATFKDATPRLAAKLERDTTIGREFVNNQSGTGPKWKKK